MNVIFAVIFLSSAVYLTVTSPERLLSALTDGSRKALELSFTLMVVYSVWLGVFRILEDGRYTEKFARLLNKPVRLLYGNVSDEGVRYLSLNFTANLLGLGAVATPMGIKAAQVLDEENNEYAKCMLFVVAATSLQILPATVITLRARAGSVNPSDIFLPSLISTAVSTLCGILLTRIFVKK